jgi:asparagine synthase (glutamine-hydrolysing)
MCGIAGFAGSGDRRILAAMTAALFHRGPDGEGFHVDDAAKVFLGHRRLAILDIAGGVQPMWNEDGTVAVVFNGEIYNHRELRAELKRRGHRFATDHSDTEVLVHGFEEWGAALVERIDGMFAFVVYDARRRRLFLARDRFGKKPLFYAERAGCFAFASELPAILRHPAVPRDLDDLSLRKFFAYGFFPAPHTPYRAVRSLPGGHSAVFDLAAGRLSVARYWRFRIEPEEPAADEAALAEELRDLLSAAVARRLESDVPLGILLSGGIDSSAVLALAARHVPADRLNTFAVGFTEPSFDESPFAALMASAVGSRHHAITHRLEDARHEIDGLLARLGEPIGDSSVLPTSLVSRFARQSVTVALGGDGGDELFAGYDPVAALKASRLYQRLVPRRLHPAIAAAAAWLPRSDRNMSLDFKVRRWLRGVGARPALWNPLWLSALAPDEIAELFGTRTSAEELYSEAVELWEACASPDDLDRTLEFFTVLYLQNDILVKVDRASMLASLEVRAPFLDRALVDFARRLPHRFKFRNGERKYLLKRALSGIVPDRILRRPKKGFGIPLAKWLRDLPPPAAPHRGVADAAWLERRWERHRAGAEDCRFALWCWLALERHLAAQAGFGEARVPAVGEPAKLLG